MANSNANHLVISEIQIGGETVYDEFIELYNPTNLDVNLEDWDVKKKTKSGSESNILNNIEGIIFARGYFLIAPRANCGESKIEKCYQGNVAADNEYTTNSFLANDNTVLLYDGDGNLVDKIGWGEASDFEGEAIDLNLKNNQSLVRKIVDNIIQDTNNNKNDFVLRDNLEPQNSNNNGDDSVQDGSSQETGANDGDISVDNDNDDDEIPPAPFVKGGVDDIIITEFLLDPEGSDKSDEFIELYNNGDEEVDLGGCVLEDKMGSVKKFVISEGTKIGAGKYKAFYSDETKITLNNSGDGIVLRDYKNNIIDETEISDSALKERAFALDENENWVWTMKPTPGRENVIKTEETNEIKDSESDNNKISPAPFVKGEIDDNNNDDDDDEHTDSTALRDNGANGGDDYDFSDRIIISEIYPNSEGRDNRNGNYEWIEIYNDSDREVNLNGWMLDDILEKGSKAYVIENEIIKARSYEIFDAARTKIALNNTGDEVNLLWPDGTIVDKIKYEKADEGLSYNLANDESWFWSSVITPEEENRSLNFIGKSNKIEYDTEEAELPIGSSASDEEDLDYVEVSLEDIKHFTKYSKIKTSGIVSTPPGIFADNIFYISGSGIQVYSYENKIPNLNIGDEVEIIGRISEVGGERRILLDKDEDLKIISHDNLVQSEIILTGNVGKTVEGYLITIEGKVSQIKSDVFYLDDGSGEVKIYLKPQTEIKKPEIKIGDWMVITGQVSQTSLGYRILPRFQGDLRLSRVSGIAKASEVLNVSENVKNFEGENKSGNFVFYGIMIVVSILILVDWIRIKIDRSKKKVSEN
ncbi:MAG: lamin tail domain-containing protein [Candidatus Pacebacteria bacterium]|nr:lamin tail domain-containing protein [Candidatus Paceibacterota bacterium]